MDIAGFLPIAVSFVVGAISIALIGWFYIRRYQQTAEAGLDEKLKANERENEYKLQELKSKADLELEKKRLKLEQDLKDRELDIKRREEEAMTTLMSAEKERESLEKRRAEVEQRLENVEANENQLRESLAEYRRKLQEVSDLSMETARERLFEEAREECEEEIRELKEDLLNRSEKEIREEARRTLIATMQRLSTTPHEDITATIVSIPSDDMKGRIIGREGRNIKSFESLTGTTLLIDETPDSVLVSSFDPFRREIARIALESLIRDGRIHPSSIEEAVKKAEEDVKASVLDSGEEALRRVRLNKMHPEIVNSIGQLRFRLSNNQNSLEHSIEVAKFCALMAAELQLDTEIAKRAGLLHDIGKVLDQDHEGSHAMAGAYFLKRIGTEDERVINAVAAHHEEVPAESPYVALVMIADSLSAMRPGARADSLDGYIQRVQNLEEIARRMEGVEDAYAIQAGREIRVIVSPEKVSDSEASLLARKIRRGIEDELQYPGTIKVTVIREKRFSETAK